jgi:hypothetical protein
MEPPAEVFEHILPQTITFSRPDRAVVGRAITFHGEYVPTRPIRVSHAEVDQETSRTHLRIGQIPKAPDNVAHILLERRVGIAAGGNILKDASALRKFQKALQDTGPLAAGTIEVYVPGIKRDEDFASNSGAGEKYI